MFGDERHVTHRQFETPLRLHEAIRLIMTFSDEHHTVTLTEDAEGDLVYFHIDYVESNNRIAEVTGLMHLADDDDMTYVEYTSEIDFKPYSIAPSLFVWTIAITGVIWVISGLAAILTGGRTWAMVFFVALIVLIFINRIDNDTSPDYNTLQDERQYLIQRLNAAFELNESGVNPQLQTMLDAESAPVTAQQRNDEQSATQQLLE